MKNKSNYDEYDDQFSMESREHASARQLLEHVVMMDEASIDPREISRAEAGFALNNWRELAQNLEEQSTTIHRNEELLRQEIGNIERGIRDERNMVVVDQYNRMLTERQYDMKILHDAHTMLEEARGIASNRINLLARRVESPDVAPEDIDAWREDFRQQFAENIQTRDNERLQEAERLHHEASERALQPRLEELTAFFRWYRERRERSSRENLSYARETGTWVPAMTGQMNSELQMLDDGFARAMERGTNGEKISALERMPTSTEQGTNTVRQTLKDAFEYQQTFETSSLKMGIALQSDQRFFTSPENRTI